MRRDYSAYRPHPSGRLRLRLAFHTSVEPILFIYFIEGSKSRFAEIKKPPAYARGLFNFGGEGGIRTLDRDKPIHTFQACAFSRSATSPKPQKQSYRVILRTRKGKPEADL